MGKVGHAGGGGRQRAEEPQPVVVVIREGVHEAEADGAADVGHDLARHEVPDPGVGVALEGREPLTGVVLVGARDV